MYSFCNNNTFSSKEWVAQTQRKKAKIANSPAKTSANLKKRKSRWSSIVGDSTVGKSCLIHNYLENTFDDEYEPTVLDVYYGTKTVEGKQLKLELHDTSGDDHLGANRKL